MSECEYTKFHIYNSQYIACGGCDAFGVPLDDVAVAAAIDAIHCNTYLYLLENRCWLIVNKSESVHREDKKYTKKNARLCKKINNRKLFVCVDSAFRLLLHCGVDFFLSSFCYTFEIDEYEVYGCCLFIVPLKMCV